MTLLLTGDEKAAIEARVAALEQTAGIEVVTVITAKSDEYPEIVWEAFAFGAAFTALAVVVADLLRPEWVTGALVFIPVIVVLAAGALCALATIYVPAFARLFLRKSRAEVEVTQYANGQFLQRELFATPARTALLVVVSMLERRVVILPDKGLRTHASAAEWDGVIARMTPLLVAGKTGAAVIAGLDAVSELLAGKALSRGPANVFADAPVVDGTQS